jgi:hypothetical protein
MRLMFVLRSVPGATRTHDLRFRRPLTTPETTAENGGISVPPSTGPSTGAQSGPSEPAFADPDLGAVVAAWPALPTAIRAGILAMVRATG